MNLVSGQGQKIGYVRVSTVDQNTERQLDGLTLNAVFEDKLSGKDTNRPQLQACLKHLRAGDTLYVHSLDRLGRDMRDLLRLIDQLVEQGVTVVFVNDKLTFDGSNDAMLRLQLHILGAFAEFERARSKERQAEGIRKAKQRGVYKGRKPALNEAQKQELKERIAKGEKKTAIAKAMGITRQTVYSYLDT